MRIFSEKLINDVLFNAQLNNLGINSFLDTNANNNDNNSAGSVVSRVQSITATDDSKQSDKKQATQQTTAQQCSNKSIFTVSDGNNQQLANEEYTSGE